jgi:hypothetical protein
VRDHQNGPRGAAADLAFADVTGTVTAGGIEAALLLDHPYARSLGRFGSTVTRRYRALLSELDATAADAHSQIVAAMISGDLAPLEAWLDGRRCRRRTGSAPRSAAKRGPAPASSGLAAADSTMDNACSCRLSRKSATDGGGKPTDGGGGSGYSDRPRGLMPPRAVWKIRPSPLNAHPTSTPGLAGARQSIFAPGAWLSAGARTCGR